MLDELYKFTKLDKPRVVVCSGAGLSAPSGLRTFRGDDGLWNEFDINQVCLISNFVQNYELIHEFYNQYRAEMKNVIPNAMHKALAELEVEYGEQFLHMTTNVDDLAERCNGNPYHIHGKITEIVSPFRFIDYNVIDIGYEPFDYKSSSEIVKPNVTFFGEAFRYDKSGTPYNSLYMGMDMILSSLCKKDLLIIIGSSNTVIQWTNYTLRTNSMNINTKSNEIDHKYNYNIYGDCSSDNVINEMKTIIKQFFEDMKK